jgi:3-oxoacyl-[acyl-carrier protein] reductase
MNLGIQGKVALVTGGASGIGKAIVLELAREGAHVAFTSRRADDLGEVKSEVEALGVKALPIVADVVVEGEPGRVVAEVQSKLGDVDILVNNVGDTLGVLDPLCSLTDWRRLFRLNLEVHVELNNAVIPRMKEKQWGRIVNISAGASLENSGPVPYCLSAVLPGVVLTERGHWSKVLVERPEHAEKYLKERTPLERFGRTDEISPMVALLCSEKASFCQGGIYPVDGGQSKHYFNIDGF